MQGGDYDGCRCVVVSVKTQGINKPKVALYRDAQGNEMEPLEVDLRELSNVTLESVPE